MGEFTITQSTPNLERIYLYPNGDLSSCTNWTAVGDTNNYECVDEEIIDTDNYIEISNGNTTEKDFLEVENSSHSGDIKFIKVECYVTSDVDTISGSSFYIGISPGSVCGTEHYSNNIPLVTQWRNESYVWEDNPADDEAWEWSDIDSLSIGVKGFSPTIASQILTEYLSPDGNDRFYLTSLSGYAKNYLDVAGWNNWVYEESTTMAGSSAYDIYTVSNESGMIPGDVVRLVRIQAYAWTDSTATLTIGAGTETNGLTWGNEHTLTNSGKYYSQEWTTNPNTGAAWTEAEVNDLTAGIKLEVESSSDGVSSYAYCRYVTISVEYTRTSDFAKFRVARERLVVGYEADSRSTTLNKPDVISIDHDRNVKMLNFWDGTREVYDLERNSKTTIMKGMEWYSSTCTNPGVRIDTIRQYAKNGATITIDDMDMPCFNGDYKIRSFGWKLVSNCPETYQWILELEDTELL